MARIKKGDLVFDGPGVSAPIARVTGFLNRDGKRWVRLHFCRTGNAGIAPLSELRKAK